jgi:hypothetical protein
MYTIERRLGDVKTTARVMCQLPAFVPRRHRNRLAAHSPDLAAFGGEDPLSGSWTVYDTEGKVLVTAQAKTALPAEGTPSAWQQLNPMSDAHVLQAEIVRDGAEWKVARVLLYLPPISEKVQVLGI